MKARIVTLTLACAAIGAVAQPALWMETAGTMILSNRAPGTVKEIVLTGVRNECVSAQLALRSEDDAAQPCQFEWTALKNSDGKEIARGHIELFREADIEVTHGSVDNKCKDPLRARTLGMFPDALVPLYAHDGANVANSIKPEKGRTIPFWVDIAVPAGTPAGLYTGSITLKTGENPLAIPVKLTVANVEIPADTTIPSLYSLRTHKHIVQNLDTYVRDLMAHRIQPVNVHYRELSPDLTDRYNPGGKGFVALVYGGSADVSQKTADNLKTVTAHLKEKGLFDRTFLLLKDEPKAEDMARALEVAKFVLQTCPEWKGKMSETLSSDEGGELFQLLDHHVYPLARYGAALGGPGSSSGKNKYGRAEWDKICAHGDKKLWFYMSNNQGTPFPTLDINTPEVAFEPRIVMWMWWFEKSYGHLYWDILYKEGWKLAPKFPPGDGQLAYEGDLSVPEAPAWAQVKDIKAPVISRRLKLMRNGIGEWEMLRMAEKKFGYEKVSPIVAKVYDHMGGKYEIGKPMWSYKESDWDSARAELIKLLENK